MSTTLTPRLAAAIPYIRPGRLVADIGTDHAYLPIALCEAGICTPQITPTGDILAAIAADINRGPVERATVHIAAAGLSDRIKTVQTDGLTGLEDYDPADVLVFGMGGELIVSILEAAPWVRRAGRRLVLQPMTHAEDLRAYLSAAGYAIVGETLAREGERIYQIICAEPTDFEKDIVAKGLSNAELMVGERRHRREDADQLALWGVLIDRTLRTVTAARDARRTAEQETSEADALIEGLAALRGTV